MPTAAGRRTATGRRAAALALSVGLDAPTRRAGPAGAKAEAEAAMPAASKILRQNWRRTSQQDENGLQAADKAMRTCAHACTNFIVRACAARREEGASPVSRICSPSSSLNVMNEDGEQRTSEESLFGIIQSTI
jgi:hypothetical protein